MPLYLLVDSRTASASEIMAAALQDNGRATLVGPGKTFGKGRIQNVQQLEDGSGVAVTKAKGMTPSGTSTAWPNPGRHLTCGALTCDACMSAVQ